MASSDHAEALAGEQQPNQEEKKVHTTKEKTQPWTPEEDDKIKKLVSKLGVRRWCKMAEEMPERTPKQIRERWHNQLNPVMKKTPWTHEVTLTNLNFMCKAYAPRPYAPRHTGFLMPSTCSMKNMTASRRRGNLASFSRAMLASGHGLRILQQNVCCNMSAYT